MTKCLQKWSLTFPARCMTCTRPRSRQAGTLVWGSDASNGGETSLFSGYQMNDQPRHVDLDFLKTNAMPWIRTEFKSKAAFQECVSKFSAPVEQRDVNPLDISVHCIVEGEFHAGVEVTRMP